MELVITSYIDNNYYIIDNTIANIFILATILDNNNYTDYANLILEYRELLNKQDKKLFIEKNSMFGIIISKLITDKKITDENNVIKKEELINALINSINNESYSKYYQTIKKLIKTNKIGNISDIATPEEQEKLRTISMIGKKQDYLQSLTRNLTGFEEDGILLKGNNCYNFNIVTKKQEEISPDSTKKRVKHFK